VQAVEWPLQHAAAFARLNVRPPRGVLLHGPPGCCKTTLARAAATAAAATLLPLSGADIFSMYVGEGEAIVRELFARARMAAPAIVFLDEVDALASRRSSAGGESMRPSLTLPLALMVIWALHPTPFGLFLCRPQPLTSGPSFILVNP
jgi:ATP-dependent 26S proteasome regulatory subunit